MLFRITLGVAGFFALLFVLWVAVWRGRNKRLHTLRMAGRWRDALDLTRSWCGPAAWIWLPLDLLFDGYTPDTWYALELSRNGYAKEAEPLVRRLLGRLRNRKVRLHLGLTLGQCLMDLGKLEEAEAAFRAVVANPERSASVLAAHYSLALLSLKRGNLRGALAAINDLKDPDVLVTGLHLKIYILCFLGEFEAAFRECLRLMPEARTILSHADAGDPESRVKDPGEATAHPLNPSLGWISLSRIAWMAGWRRTAQWLLQTLAETGDFGLSAHVAREQALLWALLGEREKAQLAMEEAEDLEHDFPDNYAKGIARQLTLSKCWRLLNDPRRAEECAMSATEHARTPFDRHEAWYGLGQSRLLANRRSEAGVAFKECLAAGVESVLASDARRQMEAAGMQG